MKESVRILWFETLDSTNNEAQRRLDDLDNLSVLAAREQTAGRGQRGNRWHAAPGENLTFSLVFKPGFPLPAAEAFGIRTVQVTTQEQAKEDLKKLGVE
jgi:BirA family biotin operon repressor/biotin-[acetyl-CoA-carboxylase] ligase